EMLASKGHPRPIRKFFKFGSCTFHCQECGGALSGYNRLKVQINGTKHSYIYYQCTNKLGTCSQKGVREEIIENQIIHALESIYMPHCIYTFVLDLLNKETSKVILNSKDIEKSTDFAYKESLKKIDGLIDMRARN